MCSRKPPLFFDWLVTSVSTHSHSLHTYCALLSSPLVTDQLQMTCGQRTSLTILWRFRESRRRSVVVGSLHALLSSVDFQVLTSQHSASALRRHPCDYREAVSRCLWSFSSY